MSTWTEIYRALFTKAMIIINMDGKVSQNFTVAKTVVRIIHKINAFSTIGSCLEARIFTKCKASFLAFMD